MDRISTSKTLNVLSLALLAGYFIFPAKWLLWTAFLVLLSNVLELKIASAVACYWMKLAFFLGKINTRIFLTIIFYAVLTPVAFIYRLFNKDINDHFRINNRVSYFEKVNRSYGKSDFEKLW